MSAAIILAHGDGEELLPELTPARLVTAWTFDWALAIGIVVVAALYLFAVTRLRRRGDAWSPGRSASFVVGGLGSIAVATMSSLGTYDDTLFWVHMVQHMVLSMVAPVFLALGAPVTLALRTLPQQPRHWLLAVLHSRVARFFTFPLVTVPLFVGTLYGLYFTPLYEAALFHNSLHEVLHLHFILVGCLFFWPILGLDPIPGRLPYPARLLVLFVTVPIHAWLGIVLMQSSQVIASHWYTELGRDWGPSLIDDQHLGGAILWGSGDIVSLLFLAVIFVQWIRADRREANRTDRALDRSQARLAGGTADAADEDAYTAYNAKLARLAEADERRN